MPWQPVKKFESKGACWNSVGRLMAGETKAGAMSPILPFGSCACRERFFQTAPGLCLGKGVNWVAQSKQMGCGIQDCSLAVNFLFSTICLLSLNIGRKKSMKNKDRTTLKKHTQNQIEMETKNGNGITLHGPRERWWLRRICSYMTCKRCLRRRIMGCQKKCQ